MRFDPQKALEAAEMIPPGRNPGSENHDEAGRVVSESLEKQGWRVDEQEIKLASDVGLRRLVLLCLLWAAAGLLFATGKLDLEWAAVLLVLMILLDSLGFFALLSLKYVTTTLLTFSLEKEVKSLPCVYIAVSMRSQRFTSHLNQDWTTRSLGMIKYFPVPIIILLISHLFIENRTLSRLVEYLFLMAWLCCLATLISTAFHFNRKANQLRSGKSWPENREAIGFVIELARAWAARPSNKVALRLYFVPMMVQKGSLTLSNGPLIWVEQPGSEPALVISGDGSNDLLERVCQDLRIPFETIPTAVFKEKNAFKVSGRVAAGATEVSPQCMLLMSQVIHQAALRWAKQAGGEFKV